MMFKKTWVGERQMAIRKQYCCACPQEGARRNFDVIVLLGKILKGSSEFRSAAAISEAIMRLVPGLSCDIRDLLSRAKTIEQDLMKVRAGQKNSTINLYR
jgi:hypothetical protein